MTPGGSNQPNPGCKWPGFFSMMIGDEGQEKWLLQINFNQGNPYLYSD